MTPPRLRQPSKARLEALSDGVFAVAITLLVLSIGLPSVRHGHLWHELGVLWLSYVAYGVSFLTIGVMWVNHHNLFGAVGRVDHGLIYRNLGLLAVVSFIPFPTEVLATYVQGHGRADQRAAAGFYGIAMIALGIAFTFLWAHLVRHPWLLAPGVSTADIRGDLLRSAGGTGAYLVGTLVSAVAPVVSLAFFTGLLLVFAAVGLGESGDNAPATTESAGG